MMMEVVDPRGNEFAAILAAALKGQRLGQPRPRCLESRYIEDRFDHAIAGQVTRIRLELIADETTLWTVFFDSLSSTETMAVYRGEEERLVGFITDPNPRAILEALRAFWAHP